MGVSRDCWATRGHGAGNVLECHPCLQRSLHNDTPACAPLTSQCRAARSLQAVPVCTGRGRLGLGRSSRGRCQRKSWARRPGAAACSWQGARGRPRPCAEAETREPERKSWWCKCHCWLSKCDGDLPLPRLRVDHPYRTVFQVRIRLI